MLLAEFAEELDVLAPVLFEFADVLVHLLLGEGFEAVVRRRSAVLVGHFNVAAVLALRFDDHSAPVDAVLLGDVLVEEELSVGDVGRRHRGREEEESDDALPDLHDAHGRDGQDDVEPNVGENGPGGRDEEDAQVFDLAHLPVGDDVDAEADDHKQVERR